MIKKWSMSYPAVNGTEQRRAYVYLPPCTRHSRSVGSPCCICSMAERVFQRRCHLRQKLGVADYLDYTDTPLIVAAIECNAGANNRASGGVFPLPLR